MNSMFDAKRVSEEINNIIYKYFFQYVFNFSSFIYLNIHSIQAIPMLASKHEKASISKRKRPIHRNSLPMDKASREKKKKTNMV